MEKYLVLVA